MQSMIILSILQLNCMHVLFVAQYHVERSAPDAELRWVLTCTAFARRRLKSKSGRPVAELGIFLTIRIHFSSFRSSCSQLHRSFCHRNVVNSGRAKHLLSPFCRRIPSTYSTSIVASHICTWKIRQIHIQVFSINTYTSQSSLQRWMGVHRVHEESKGKRRACIIIRQLTLYLCMLRTPSEIIQSCMTHRTISTYACAQKHAQQTDTYNIY